MKTNNLVLLISLLTISCSFGQTVNNEKIDVDTFEVWAFKKPFNNKESYFANYGQKKFRPHYYDHKTQIIKDNEGKAFDNGEWLSLISFLKNEGWVKSDERHETIGNLQGRVVTFERL